ncbi:MAG: hypothetical protein RTV72_08090 [Candidatus Thorarchaeota archaeon]
MPVFPPGDVLRDASLFLMSGVCFYSSLLAGILYRDWYNKPMRRITDIQFAWATFLLGMVANRGAFILADFYYIVDPWNTYFTKLGYIGLILSLTAFFFAMELMIPYKTRNIFFFTGMIHVALAMFFPRALLDIVAISIALVTVVGVLLFLNYTMKNTSGEVRKSIKTIVAGFLLGYFGFIFASDMSYNAFGFGPYLIGEASLAVGLVIFGLGTFYSPALEELDWKDKLVELYFIQKGGLLVYHHEFERTSELDEVLTAAGIAGIQSLFREITAADSELNIVSVGQYEILFSYSDTFNSVLIAKAPYKILLGKLNEITSTFEVVFGNIIQNFEGNLAEFSSAKNLVTSIF